MVIQTFRLKKKSSTVFVEWKAASTALLKHRDHHKSELIIKMVQSVQAMVQIRETWISACLQIMVQTSCVHFEDIVTQLETVRREPVGNANAFVPVLEKNRRSFET